MALRSSSRAAFVLMIAGLAVGAGVVRAADLRSQLDAYLNQVGYAQLEQRTRVMAAVQTREQAEQHRTEVRKKILDLMGGLPEAQGPVRVRALGQIAGDGFRIEKIAYESLPGFFVTANVYVPASRPGPLPAVIVTPGHGPWGKLGEATWGASFARAGLVALVIDAFGQGERVQHYDPELDASKVEPSGEHEHASVAALLTGKHVSRYFVNDGMRGVDYLAQRKDVDAARIGAFGCSGGGTATAYLGALDPRIRATVSACYVTSFKELLPTRGPQDAEQTLPDFLTQGLDFADWVELAAPRPYAIVATTEDMFPFAGTQQTFEEAKRIYSLLGAEDQIELISGPGGHGNLPPLAPRIVGFLLKHLRGEAGAFGLTPFRPERPDDLLVTPTGQLSTSFGTETVESLSQKEAQGRIVSAKVVGSQQALALLKEGVARDVRAVTRATAEPGAPPEITVIKEEQRDGYRVRTLSIQSEPGIDLPAIEAVPDGAGRRPVVLMMDTAALERVAAMRDIERLAKSGRLVVALQARGALPEAQAPPPSSVLGGYTAVALRAMIVGKSLVGMRADDTIRVVNWLMARPDVEPSSITLYGRGALGMVALHAAALDPRISRVVVEGALASYRLGLAAPLHRNLSEIVLRGVLLRYDTTDLLEAIAPRPAVLVNPAGAMGQTLRDDVVERELAAVFDSDRKLGLAGRVRVVRRGFFDPLPVD